MISTIASTVTPFVLLGCLLVVHEAGHYVAGAIAGIPARARRIVMLAVPPHVALADGDEWVTPFQNDRYSTVYGRYDPPRRYAKLYTAGGILAQTLVVPVGVVLGLVGVAIGAELVRLSLGFLVVYLCWDLLATAYRGRAFGDTTQLWRLSPLYGVSVLLATFAVHVGGLIVLSSL